MATVQERLREQDTRAGKLREIAARAQAENRDFNEAEQREWEDLNAAYDAEKAELDRAANSANRQARLDELDADSKRTYGPGANPTPPNGGARNTPTDGALNRALRGWAAGRKARAEDAKIARELGIDLESGEISIRLNDRQGRTSAEIWKQSRDIAGLNNGLQGSQGGFLVIPQFAATFDEAMLEYDDMRAYADVIRTETGANMSWPGGDDTGNTGEWLAVDVESAEEELAFVTSQFSAHVISSKAIRVDRALLQDASYDLVGRIGRACGTRIGRGMAAAHTTGDGVGKPKGIVNDAYLGKTSSSTGDFKFDDVMDLIGSVGTAYARNAKIMCHRLIKWELRKKKDGNGRYLWEPQLQAAGMPDSVLGYPIVENSNMSSDLTTGQKIMLFGDLNYYKIRDVSTITLQRLVEKYALKNQDGFVAFARTDGMLLQSGQSAATKPIKYLALL